MTQTERHPTSRAGALAILVVLAALSAFYAYTSLVPSAASSSPIKGRPSGDLPRDNAVNDDDGGRVRGVVTAFDGSVSAVSNLDPKLLAALRRASMDAADDGVELQVTSGWRSTDYQDQLLRDAVSKYGSKREAARWVATPDTSPHVSGDAVDMGPKAAIGWLSRHGAAYGLCQVYDNEPWHFERRSDAAKHGCPRTYADPTHDPRMQP